METWKSIEGFEGLYEVSDLGRVRSLDRMHPRQYPIKGCIISQRMGGGRNHNKYPTITITRVNPKIRTDKLVHRLVAMAFIPNPENKPEVNHKDGDKTNNKVNNLEWSTRKENVRHSSENGLLMTNGAHFNAILNLEQVKEIKIKLANGFKRSALAKEYNIGYATISLIGTGKQWKHVTI
jgi:hypothetical protein